MPPPRPPETARPIGPVYRHRQPGTLLLLALGAGAALVAGLLAVAGVEGRATVLPVLVLVIIVPAAFLLHSLTVEVDPERVRASFGPGLIRKSFAVSRIRGARAVRNRWYYGWGIRFTPHGWLFNVSGLDAVELELEEGRRFRIGTDDPHGLLAAIQQVATLDD